MRNYYDDLEIAENASQEVIKASYRALVKKYHPDNYKGDVDVANAKLLEITEAYNILTDENRRKEYDNIRKNNTRNDCKDLYSDAKEQKAKGKNGKENACSEGFFSNLFNNIMSSVEENRKIYENAYIEGLNLDERILARRYKNEICSLRIFPNKEGKGEKYV